MRRYLPSKVAEARQTELPAYHRYRLTEMGYTTRSGAPTTWMVRLEGETRWRRVMCWCFSNIGTLFVRIKGEPVIVPDHAIPQE